MDNLLLVGLVVVPLWILAAGVVTLVVRDRGLSRRPGDITVRVRRPGRARWARAHARWVSDVLAWRQSPAPWHEDLTQVVTATFRDAEPEELKPLRGLGPTPVVAALTTADGRLLHVAGAARDRSLLIGPFLAAAGQS